MALRMLDTEDWLIAARLAWRDPDTGILTPLPVNAADLAISFSTAAGAPVGDGTIVIADSEQGRLFIAVKRDARAPLDFGDAQTLSVFGDLMARESAVVDWRSRGRISLTVFKGH